MDPQSIPAKDEIFLEWVLYIFHVCFTGKTLICFESS